jgi:predicted adenine nucleotide alpha hydrolase (AANH) superfamily ATPase
MKLLLHSCCGPCTVQCAAALLEEGIRPGLFWYNPNIHPLTEYRSRRDTLVQYAAETKLDLVMEDEYGLRSFIAGVYPDFERTTAKIEGAGSGGTTTGKGRCAFCYRTRLEKTARQALAEGFDHFSSTLLISPYQNHELIRSIGEELAERFGIPFLYRDFRPRFREGQAQARERGYYMQKYCGCIFSEEERYAQAYAKKPKPGDPA